MSLYTNGNKEREAEIARIIDTLREDRSDARLRQMVVRAFNLGIEVAAQCVDHAMPYDGIPQTAKFIRKQQLPETDA